MTNAFLALVASIIFFLLAELLRAQARKSKASPLPVLVRVRASSLPGAQLRFLASCVQNARLRSGARILDGSDFREWLLELAEAADEVTA